MTGPKGLCVRLIPSGLSNFHRSERSPIVKPFMLAGYAQHFPLLFLLFFFIFFFFFVFFFFSSVERAALSAPSSSHFSLVSFRRNRIRLLLFSPWFLLLLVCSFLAPRGAPLTLRRDSLAALLRCNCTLRSSSLTLAARAVRAFSHFLLCHSPLPRLSVFFPFLSRYLSIRRFPIHQSLPSSVPSAGASIHRPSSRRSRAIFDGPLGDVARQLLRDALKRPIRSSSYRAPSSGVRGHVFRVRSNGGPVS